MNRPMHELKLAQDLMTKWEGNDGLTDEELAKLKKHLAEVIAQVAESMIVRGMTPVRNVLTLARKHHGLSRETARRLAFKAQHDPTLAGMLYHCDESENVVEYMAQIILALSEKATVLQGKLMKAWEIHGTEEDIRAAIWRFTGGVE